MVNETCFTRPLPQETSLLHGYSTGVVILTKQLVANNYHVLSGHFSFAKAE